MSDESIEQRAGVILAIRPELQGHLGAAFTANHLFPVARGAHFPGGAAPLAIPSPANRLNALSQEAARRDTPMPEGTVGLRPARLSLASGLPDHLRALLDAPLIAAEIAARGVARADLETLFQLIALRQADPVWFDATLPAAVQLAAQETAHD